MNTKSQSLIVLGALQPVVQPIVPIFVGIGVGFMEIYRNNMYYLSIT